MYDHADAKATRRLRRDRFLTRVAILVGAAALAFLLWHIRHALILGFGGVVVAVIICAIADPLRRTGLSRNLCVLSAIAIIFGLLGIFGWIAMPQLQSQGRTLFSELPMSISELDDALGRWLPDGAMTGGGLMGDLAARLASWSGMLLGAVTSLILLISAGAFMAASPHRYRDGLVSLFAPARQDGLRDALDVTGTRLKAWLLAKLMSMAVIGTAVAIATWMLGLSTPLALGLIAGLFAFVPIVGPIAASIPALLLALTISPTLVLWTALAYFAVEQLESNLVLPLLEGSSVELPPALLIFAFAALGLVFGFAGIILAAPLTVALYSLVLELYVKPLNGQK